jgi:hypothetical protein
MIPLAMSHGMAATTPDSATAPLRLSLVVEWDNVLLSDPARARSMLAELARQLASLRETTRDHSPLRVATPVELVIVHDETQVAREAVQAAVRAARVEDTDTVVGFASACGATYYELKNLGAARARGDVIVMLDSDVIPEPDWLVRLLESFADPQVSVVGGNSYIEPTSTYARAFALGWLMPLRSDEGDALHEANNFHANNLAFRAEVLRRHAFPPLPGACRGSASLLAEQLRRAGIRVHRNPRARVAHPAPRPRHFVRRSLAQGRDNLIRRSRGADRPAASLRASWRDVRQRTLRAWRRIRRHHRRVGMSDAAVPLALLVITTYYALFLAGDVLTRLAPDAMQRHLRV